MPSDTPGNNPPLTPASETLAGSSSSAEISQLESCVKWYLEKNGLKLSDLKNDDNEMQQEVKIPAFYIPALNIFVEETKKGVEEAKKGIENAEVRLEDAEKMITTLKETVEDSDKVIKILGEKIQALGNLIDGQAILIVELYRQIHQNGNGDGSGSGGNGSGGNGPSGN